MERGITARIGWKQGQVMAVLNPSGNEKSGSRRWLAKGGGWLKGRLEKGALGKGGVLKKGNRATSKTDPGNAPFVPFTPLPRGAL